MAMADMVVTRAGLNMGATPRNLPTWARARSWVGRQHFTDGCRPSSRNLGDDYFHSGIRDPTRLATHTPSPYKILYNDAVPMTGGQPHDGNVHPWTISSRSMRRSAPHRPGERRPGQILIRCPSGLRHDRSITRRARRGPARAARGPGRLRHDTTRPCGREAPRAKRGHLSRSARRVSSTGGVRGLRRLLDQSNCLSVVAGRDSSSAGNRAIDHVVPQQDFSCPNGFRPA